MNRTAQNASIPEPMRELTVKEYAAHERVTTRTVWQWIGKGAIPVRRTPGGGVRVQVFRISSHSAEV